MKNSIFIFALFFICSFVAFAQDTLVNKGTIMINIKSIKSDKGRIFLSLYKNKKGFPADPEKAFKRIYSTIMNKDSMLIEIKDLNYGEYAIGVFHDEDNNGEMKTGIFGIPKEGYGVSNNVKGTFGPPNYEDAKFFLNSKKIIQSIIILN